MGYSIGTQLAALAAEARGAGLFGVVALSPRADEAPGTLPLVDPVFGLVPEAAAEGTAALLPLVDVAPGGRFDGVLAALAAPLALAGWA
jgi:hypothetical protein